MDVLYKSPKMFENYSCFVQISKLFSKYLNHILIFSQYHIKFLHSHSYDLFSLGELKIFYNIWGNFRLTNKHSTCKLRFSGNFIRK